MGQDYPTLLPLDDSTDHGRLLLGGLRGGNSNPELSGGERILDSPEELSTCFYASRWSALEHHVVLTTLGPC